MSIVANGLQGRDEPLDSRVALAIDLASLWGGYLGGYPGRFLERRALEQNHCDKAIVLKNRRVDSDLAKSDKPMPS